MPYSLMPNGSSPARPMFSRFLYFILFTGLISCNRTSTVSGDWDEGILMLRESCKTEDVKDYWLVNFSVDAASPKIGDTITINGQFYDNVLKVSLFKQPEMKIGNYVKFNYQEVSPDKKMSSNCDVSNPATYAVRELRWGASYISR